MGGSGPNLWVFAFMSAGAQKGKMLRRLGLGNAVVCVSRTVSARTFMRHVPCHEFHRDYARTHTHTHSPAHAHTSKRTVSIARIHKIIQYICVHANSIDTLVYKLSRVARFAFVLAVCVLVVYVSARRCVCVCVHVSRANVRSCSPHFAMRLVLASASHCTD